MAAVAQQARTSSAVQRTAAELLPTTPELGQGMGEYLAATIPEIAAIDDDDLLAELRASAEANVGQVLRMLARGASVDEVTTPVEALDYLRGNVRRGLPLSVLLRSYRLGHAWLWEHWSEALQEHVVDSGELGAGQDESSAFMFAYVDKVSDALVEEFGSERERMLRSAAQIRAETVRGILAAESVDAELASRRLGYQLHRHHVALRVSSGASAVDGLERAVGEAAEALDAGEPLVIPSGAARYDVWCGSFEPPATDGLERYEPPPRVVVAFGKPGEGVAGFRTSHLEAVQAARIGALMSGATTSVTSYARVELVSLLASDLPRARVFVAAQLGPLGSASEPAERLRETVLAMLVSGGSATRVAKDLFVHTNTVAYRVKQAEEMLGREIDDRPVELSCALILAAVLGPAVLARDT
jgi:PucR C-terminal helix-turn-helix domain/GGDEF-like domain